MKNLKLVNPLPPPPPLEKDVLIIIELVYNFHQNGNLNDGIGESYTQIKVGNEYNFGTYFEKNMKTVTEIKEVELRIFDVYYSDDTILRVFNPNTVTYKKLKDEGKV